MLGEWNVGITGAAVTWSLERMAQSKKGRVSSDCETDEQRPKSASDSIAAGTESISAWNELPLDLITRITSGFAPDERGAVALTNTHWCHGVYARLGEDRPLKLTDVGQLAILQRCPSISSLDLSQCTGLADSHLAQLRGLTRLRSLTLRTNTRLTDAGLSHLTPLRQLRELDISYCSGLTDVGLAHLAPLTALEELHLRGCNFTGAGFSHLAASLQKLRKLNLAWNKKLVVAELHHLALFSQLESLSLEGCDLTDAVFAHVAALKKLESLSLEGGFFITGAGLSALAPLESLRQLSLSNCNRISRVGLAELGQLSQLRDLNLNGCGMLGYIGFAPVSKLVLLEKLDFGSCGDSVHGTVLAHLAPLKELRELNLSDREYVLTDDPLASLPSLEKLETLDLSGCKYFDSHLLPLTALISLRNLNLSGCYLLTNITLRNLTLLTKLRRLDVSGCRFTPDAKEALQVALPGLTIKN